MAQSPSSTRIPVEIWEKILGNLIDEAPFLNPHLVNCGSSTELELFWRSERQYFEVEDQRLVLRLVCRNWKDFADRRSNRLVHVPDITTGIQSSDVLSSAIRLQVEPLTGNCTCDSLCTCVRRLRSDNVFDDRGGYKFIILFEQSRNETHVLAAPFFSSSLSKLRILTGAAAALTYWILPLSSLQALSLTLSVSKLAPEFQRLSKEFHSLLLLRLKVNRISQGRPGTVFVTDDHGLVLPSLKALDYHESTIVQPIYDHWNLPHLQHFSVDLPTSGELSTDFLDFLSKAGHVLKTLILHVNPVMHRSARLQLTSAFWDLVPNLTTFGSDLSFLSPISRLPTQPPIHTLIQTNFFHRQFRTETPLFSSQLLEQYDRVRTVALHRTWKDLRYIKGRDASFRDFLKRSEDRLREFLRSVKAECEARGVALQDVDGVRVEDSEDAPFLLESQPM